MQAQGSASAEAYVPLFFPPGEAYQFDWSHEIVLINGVTVTVKVAHVRLCHSRMMFGRAYPRETQEMVFDTHDRSFAFFGGACTRGTVLARKPGTLRNGAPFQGWVLPSAMERVRRRLKAADDGDRQMEALDQNVCSSAIILNILARRRDPAPAVTILTPDALRLQHEPPADCARYDSLRRAADGTHAGLELMGTLKLYGMCSAYDEVMATGIKRQHEPRGLSVTCSWPRYPRSRSARSNTSSPSPSCRSPRI
jgi:hypothetical protein